MRGKKAREGRVKVKRVCFKAQFSTASTDGEYIKDVVDGGKELQDTRDKMRCGNPIKRSKTTRHKC